MPCRVGITTDPDRRKREWRREHPHLHGWRTLMVCSSKKEAQRVENLKARKLECASSGGGDDSSYSGKRWHVYYFKY